MKGRKTLEINPDHPIITALQDKVSADAKGAKVRPVPLLSPASHVPVCDEGRRAW